jgi:DNA-directed DNA polymerase III PolC
LSPEKLAEQAAQLGYGAVALTDINNVSGIPGFVRSCRNAGVKPVAGMEFRRDDELLFVALALNNEGFREINELLSYCTINGEPLPEYPPYMPNVNIIYPFRKGLRKKLKENEWTGVGVRHISGLFRLKKEQTDRMVVLQPVTYGNKKECFLHRNLRAVDHNILLSRLTPEMTAGDDECFLPLTGLLKYFERYPRIVKNTFALLDDSNIDLEFGRDKNKATYTGSKYEDKKLLEKLANEGLVYRYGRNNKQASERLRRELQIIDKLGFSAYFLITRDIIAFSMSKGFYHVGRGSGANSVVAYCLKITDVDPLELNLYFERFLNPRRTSPPDFDIDYSWKEREEVQKYIFEKFGKNHVALLGTNVEFKGKSIYRELGKVHGLPKNELDLLVENPSVEAGKNGINRQIQALAVMMKGFPNQRSIHAGGILISEKPLTYYTAFDMPPKGFPTVQWDMYVAEDLGFEKLDILSQRGIGHIKEAVDIIRRNRGVEVDIHRVDQFKKDDKVKKQLRRAETNGCFYIESPAMRGLLKKLRCNDYLTLVAASSIIRPGVARSGMMKEYIYRFHHPGKFSYIHPVMKEQLEETYGVMVYQEDVLKVCHHFAGLDLADADVLRRAMSGKFRSKKEFGRIVDKFFANCRARGHDEKITREVWRQIESFAGYSFSKAHSASYAVESFQSLYLKAHFPLEFQVAVINNFGGFYHTWVYFNELVRLGGRLHLPCVDNSLYHTSIRGKDVYMGFVHIQKLERKFSMTIIREREDNGEFRDLEDFTGRLAPAKEQLILLIRTGAFAFTGKSKPELLWEAHRLMAAGKAVRADAWLFQMSGRQFELPELEHSLLEDAYDETELLGFPVSMNAFDMLKTRYRGEVAAANLEAYVGRVVKMTGRLVTIKYVRTVRKEMMNFGTFVDHRGDFFDTVHFPASLERYPFQGYGIYLILGKVVEEFGYASIEVQKMARLPLQPDPRA